ncbi:MAG: selenocysteine-specific translation elongation factor [Rhodanobacteraceae bacterium]|jgi:selenocysteine-specific elongation factor|nr:selenocysteine-specific translation elongation factor [Rhodanobacteraceae bacterium]
MIVGTAGHIDHGKTTLVCALTGVDTDRLKEEKARGISIELGYAYVPVESGPAAADDVLGFVDVPGHERLVHTMVAGAGGIDFALLVVAADDGVMPQTREHLAILDLLGVAQGAVALTKADRVDAERVAAVRAEVASLLAPTPLRDAPVFALDATAPDDAGVAALSAHLHAAAASQPPRRDDGLFRLAVDRVFTLPGHGTIATGTVHAGRVQVGDRLVVMPAGLPVRVRALHAQDRAAASGHAGQRCALNLAGIERSALARGDWLADPRALVPSTRLDVRLHRLADGGGALSTWAPLHVHLGTAHRLAHLVPLDGEAIGAGDTRPAQLVFDAPLCAAAGDRFVVRDAQAVRTLGGGIVLDPCAPARHRRSAARRAVLDARERVLAGQGVTALLQCAPHGIPLAELARLCGCAEERVALPDGARVVATADGAQVCLDAHWRALQAQVLAALARWHVEQPDEPGVDAGRLRRIALPTLPVATWRALVEDLAATGALARSGPWLHLPEHRVGLSAAEQALAQRIEERLVAGGFDPPWVRDLAAALQVAEDSVRQVLRKRALQGAVHAVVRDLYYPHATVRELAARLRTVADARGAIEAARYRDALGLGRKRTIQILEYFDRAGYTRRVGMAHVLRADSGWHSA